MCLLVSQPKTVSFTDDFLSSVYGSNEDGLGIMYARGGELHVHKTLPRSAEEFIDFYRQHADKRESIWHARMKTHGAIDMENCHPYQVTDDIWLAHNGILSSGNSQDVTKSDTWHFIKNIMRPALFSNPDLMLDKDSVDFIGGIIGGSNKFGLMRSDGKVAIINQHSGIMFMQSWLSNTYAWDAHKFGVKSSKSSYTKYWNETDDYYFSRTNSLASLGRETTVYPTLGYEPEQEDEPLKYSGDQIKKFARAAYNQWTRRGREGIAQWVDDAPSKAAALIGYWYEMNSKETQDLVFTYREEAAEWIEELFTKDSITPSWIA